MGCACNRETNIIESHTLLVHKMCPFAQRSLLVAAYKNLQIKIEEVSLIDKPKILLDANPNGKVPVLLLT